MAVASLWAAVANAIERSTTRGPFTIVVRTDRDEMTVADRLRVEVWITMPPGARAEIADPGSKLGGFTVVSREPLPPRPAGSDRARGAATGGGVRTGMVLVLEPFLAGDYEVPALTAACAEADGTRTDLASEPLVIPVRSIADDDATEPAAARGVVDPPTAVGARWWWIAGAGCAAAVAGGVAARRRRPRHAGSGVRAAIAALEARRGGGGGPLAAEDADAIVRALRAAVAARSPARAGLLDANGLWTCAAGALTPTEAEALRAVLARCDAARFGAESAGDAPADIDAALAACRSLLAASAGGGT